MPLRSFILIAALLATVSVAAARSLNLEIKDDSRSAYVIETFCAAPSAMVKLKLSDIAISDGESTGNGMISGPFVNSKPSSPASFPTASSASGAVSARDDTASPSPPPPSPATAPVTSERSALMGLIVRHIPVPAGSMLASSDSSSLECSLNLLEPDEVIFFDRPERETQFLAKDGAEGLLVVMFVNCNAGTKVSYNLSMIFENFGEDGKPYHVGSGDRRLPSVFSVMTILYVATALACALHMMQRKNSCFKIHGMFLLTVVSRAIFCGASFFYYSQIVSEDSANDSIPMFYKVACYLTGFSLFVTILLIGSGWSFIRWSIHRRMRFIVALLVLLQSGYWTFYFRLEEMNKSDPDYEQTRRATHLFDLASCCAILFPIVWSIQQLKTEARSEEAAAAASTSEDPDATTSDAPAMKEKLLQLRGFYSQVVLFLYSTRILLYLIRVALDCNMSYVAVGMSEATTLVFFLTAGWKFRPRPENPYILMEMEPLVSRESTLDDQDDEESGN